MTAVLNASHIHHQRALLSDPNTLLLYVSTPTTDEQTAIEVAADGTVANLLHAAVGPDIASYEVVFQGQVLEHDVSLADAGLSMEAAVMLRAKTDCMLLTEAFLNTNAFDSRLWKQIDDFRDHSCCEFREVECDGGETGQPPKIKQIKVELQRLTGTIDWMALPRSLTLLDLSVNQFKGRVDWASLPRSLENLELNNNLFTGTVEWSDLPPRLRRLYLARNGFGGNVKCSELPSSLEILNLARNEFEGYIEWKDVPPSLRYFDLFDNLFENSMQDLEKARQELSTRGTAFYP
eukprot:CAMPEP_0197031130 /NCGR_PEP_ID=MMETSP1384-20130603/10223_1 /TAXON_ID=29189 /ORGANISM="Ammonia sp." /LENGTH=291 /DNA_ID=CAMNT_0042460615 /DNA_START=171 /DNA_END=1046 /DNA_ORIENTATION=+